MMTSTKTSRRNFLKSIAAASLTASVGSVTNLWAGEGSMRPNVVFITIEDVSPHRFGCYGNRICKTPNIDRLAAEGLRFDLAQCNAVPCNPSRSSMMTGMRPETTGIWDNGADWREILPPGSTIPEHFMANGYEAVRVAKVFHGGTSRNGKRIPFSDPSRWSQIIEAGRRRPRQISPEGPGPDMIKEAKEKGTKPEGNTNFKYGPSGLTEDEEKSADITDKAIEVLSQKREKPLFLALGYSEPHLALSAPKKYHDMYPPEKMDLPKNPNSKENGMPKDQSALEKKSPHTLEQWQKAISSEYACLSLLDYNIGRLLNHLKKTGQDKNTIVVLWSDHGFMLGEHWRWKKGGLIDEAVMVPFIVKAPGITPLGSGCKRPVESIDIFPTFCQLCDMPIPEQAEGVGMLELLKNPSMQWRKGAISCHGNASNQTIRTEKYRYIEYGGPDKAELFDHTKPEPKASINVVDEPEYAQVRKELAAILRQGPEATLPPGY